MIRYKLVLPTLTTLPQFALSFQTKNARKITGSDQGNARRTKLTKFSELKKPEQKK